MAFSDWIVETTKVVGVPNTSKNTYTGLEIDPLGVTMSRFEMTLTYAPGGVATNIVLQRSDLINSPSQDALDNYARGVITAAEKNIASQGVALLGVRDVTPPPPPDDTRTQAEKDLQAFASAEAAHAQQVPVLQKLIAADPKSTDAIQAKIDALTVAKDLAAVTAAESLAANLATPVEI